MAECLPGTHETLSLPPVPQTSRKYYTGPFLAKTSVAHWAFLDFTSFSVQLSWLRETASVPCSYCKVFSRTWGWSPQAHSTGMDRVLLFMASLITRSPCELETSMPSTRTEIKRQVHSAHAETSRVRKLEDGLCWDGSWFWLQDIAHVFRRFWPVR